MASGSDPFLRQSFVCVCVWSWGEIAQIPKLWPLMSPGCSTQEPLDCSRGEGLSPNSRHDSLLHTCVYAHTHAHVLGHSTNTGR